MDQTPPRLVATDLDGTIVRTDGTISPRTVAALTRVEQAGAEFVLVTGRPPRWMRSVAEATNHRGLAICANGALLYDLHDERVVDADLIDAGATAQAVRLLQAAIPDAAFGVEYVDGMACEEGFLLQGWDAARLGIDRLDNSALGARPCAKLLVRHPELDADALLALAAEAVGDLATATHSNGTRMVEISARGVSKASALARMCRHRGIERHEVIAFGDMPNDLPMLAFAGTSYGMANAHPDVLAAVDHVTASNDDDGVAQVLERIYPAEAAYR